MKIFLLQLHWHEKSGSSKWFIDILKKDNEVIPLSIDVNFNMCADIADAAPDMVICWQTELLVPYFISRGIPAIAIPMVDACEHRSNLYYKITGQLGSVSLSHFIKNRYKDSGVPTIHLKYYPKLEDLSVLEKAIRHNEYRNIDIFFGYRGKKWEMANNLALTLRERLNVHLHNSIDDYNEDSPIVFDSCFFPDISDLEKVLQNSNFFICPRHAEGIGLSTIKAMTRGCIPIGINGSGNCEYFDSGKLGIQVDYKYFKSNPETLVKRIRETDLNQTRKNVLESFQKGRLEFEAAAEGISAYLKNRIITFKENKAKFAKQNIFQRMLSPQGSLRVYEKISYRLLLSRRFK